MKQKYWYEEGMCKHMSYKGQWPVTYTSADGLVYKKECMACDAVSKGVCQLGTKCEVFKIATDEMESHWQLRDKKMG